MTTFVATIDAVGDVARALAVTLFMIAAVLAAGGVWGVAIWGASAWFKNFRLYNPHPIAKRIRMFLRKRRAAKAARA